jgi:PAS domain S-box-containing protein
MGRPPSAGELAARNALLTLIYFLGGKLGLALAFEHQSVSVVWPPTGIALAAVLIWGLRLWPGIFLGAFLVNMTVGQHALAADYTVACLGIAAANTLEATVGGALVRRWAHGSNTFDHPRDVFLYIVLAGVAGAGISATGGVTSLCLGDFARWDQFGGTWLTWWLGDAVSAVTVTPVLVLWHAQPRGDWSRDLVLKVAVLAVVVLGLGQAVFGWVAQAATTHHPFAFAFLPVLVWSAYALGQRETAAATLLVAGLALAGTLRGHGPFAVSATATGSESNRSLLDLGFFVGVTAVTALGLGAVVTERHRAAAALQAARDQLEARVQERTAILAETNTNLRQEIAERQHAERALRDGQRRTRDIIETAFDAFIGIDREGRIIDWNARAEAIFGWPRQEVVGRALADTVIPPALRQAHIAGLRRYLDTGQSTVLNQRLEFTALHRAGHEFPVELTIWQTRGQDPVLFYAFVHDISARKEAETKLRQAERLAAIGEMLTALAHESGNALQRSQACLELLTLRVSGNVEAQKLLDDVQKAQDHLHEMYERVRRFAAPVVLQRRPADLGQVLEEAWQHLDVARRGRQASLRQQADAVSLSCDVDRLALSQVFRNLLENSLSACADPVEIEVRWQDATWNDSPAVEAYVRDNGPGLSPEVRQRLFEPFFTTKNHGTGLGMAIARRIMEAHGGRIAAGPERDRGAEFLLTLPRYPA